MIELSQWNQDRLAEPVHRARWLIEIGTYRFTNLAHVVYDGHTFLPVSLRLSFGDNFAFSLSIEDVDGFWDGRFRHRDDARAWLLYGGDGFADGDANLYRRGFVDTVESSDKRVRVSCTRGGTSFVPRIIATSETGFNHLPPSGAQLHLPDGVFGLD